MNHKLELLVSNPRLFPHLQQLSGRRSLLWVLHQTFLHKICEFITPQLWLAECGWRVCGNHKNSLMTQKNKIRQESPSSFLSKFQVKDFSVCSTHSHRMNVCIRRLSFSHFYGRDAERPDISHTVVSDLLDHLWCHPEGCPDNCVPLCHCVLLWSV